MDGNEIKKNCIFCKIIAGEIPSKKVYEDDKVVVVLDINPITEGHVLVMPKEHYPILPMIPNEIFNYMFLKTKDLIKALKKSLLKTGSTVFIANGQVAGQNSPHFMFHVIPREEDNLEYFNLQSNNQFSETKLTATIKHNFKILMDQYFEQYPQEWKKEMIEETKTNQEPQKEEKTTEKKNPNIAQFAEIIKNIEANTQLKQLFTEDPEKILEQIKTIPKLKELFKNIDIISVIEHFNPGYGKRLSEQKEKGNNYKEATSSKEVKEKPESAELKDQQLKISGNHKEKEVINYKKDIKEILKIINENPKLKTLILNSPDIFKEKTKSIKELNKIFEGHNLDEIIRLIKENATKKEGFDLDKIAQNFKEDEPPK